MTLVSSLATFSCSDVLSLFEQFIALYNSLKKIPPGEAWSLLP